jgi:hypothetical protein
MKVGFDMGYFCVDLTSEQYDLLQEILQAGDIEVSIAPKPLSSPELERELFGDLLSKRESSIQDITLKSLICRYENEVAIMRSYYCQELGSYIATIGRVEGASRWTEPALITRIKQVISHSKRE